MQDFLHYYAVTATSSANGEIELARRVIEKAERNCLIANSLKGAMHLVPYIDVPETAVVESLAHA